MDTGLAQVGNSAQLASAGQAPEDSGHGQGPGRVVGKGGCREEYRLR
jgi:hypothetical protein